MKEKLKKLTKYYGLYDYWKEEVINLEKKNEEFDVMDLDDTLFSTQARLQSDEIFQKNRGKKWNLLIVNQLGVKNVINEYYKDKVFPKDIIDSVNKHKSLILTAGLREYQEEKVKHMWIDHFNMVITETWEDKIIALIRYIIFDLKYIPTKITVYEDRPQYFIEYRDLIEDVLWTKLEIKYIKMDWNNWYNKIEIIEWNSFDL